MEELRIYKNTDDIRLHVKNVGGHWFDPISMRFFLSRIGKEVFGDRGQYFISSEQHEYYLNGRYHKEQRQYTVRMITPEGQIETVSEFGEFYLLSEAKKWVRAMLKNTAKAVA
jgi:predicted dehydrogenase